MHVCRSNKRPFESQYEDLQQHYLRMRQKQMGESKRRRGEAGTPLQDPDTPGARKAPRQEPGGQAKGVGDFAAARSSHACCQ
jgi:hypothetical protein